MQFTYFIVWFLGVLYTSFITPFPHLLMYFLLQFFVRKWRNTKSLPEWSKRWLFVVASLLTFLVIYVFVDISNRNAADKTGAMILIFPMLWTQLFVGLIVLAELLIQLRRLLLYLLKK